MGMKRKKRASRRRGWLLGSSATQVICISFVLLIALGTLLLTLPISSRSGRLGVVDAMFTATSATCVTGLVVRDTWTQFTPFGQAVVLLLIQVGGLGLVTLTSFFALAAKRRMGFKDLRLLGESVSASGYSQATDVLKIVVKLAMTFEIIGMMLLMIAFVPQFGAEGIWISAFTAISAFCNAGFDLFGRFGQYSSLAPYVSNYYVQAVIMFLIMAGGLGFMVWVEIGEWRKKRHLSLHARMVLLFSCILWVGGAVLIGLMEWNNPKSMGGLSVPGKVMAALFQSVSTRTAGMNTIDLAACGPITKLLMSVLQFIGAAPGSTGGGVKVTTFAVLILTMRSVAQGRDDCVIGGHHIESKTVYRALTIIMLGMVAALGSAVVVYYNTSDAVTVIDAIFESCSAFGTVGLSVGVTSQLNTGAKLLYMLVMFMGRVGPVSFAISLTSKPDDNKRKILPVGQINVGIKKWTALVFESRPFFMCSQRGNVSGAESFAVDLHDIQQDFGCLVHALYGGALAHAMEVEAAGAQVGAGQALPAQGGTIGAAAHRYFLGG
ncbi:potassium uptake protein, TrkH family [Faecalibacterium duncaniae]|uniref:Potassium uptake protein, TrkH family n=3 Tax=Oscillospiraceae TaxID=216572 RepID=C7H669_FAED2|nr:potassium uptake protein, TrkH family [Faecalibacterium duncaniae]